MYRAILSGLRRFVEANHRDLLKQLLGLALLAAAVVLVPRRGGRCS